MSTVLLVISISPGRKVITEELNKGKSKVCDDKCSCCGKYHSENAEYGTLRTCLHKKCVRIFEHNFVADKAKIRRRAVARQGFLTQSAAKFAEKTCAYACEDKF